MSALIYVLTTFNLYQHCLCEFYFRSEENRQYMRVINMIYELRHYEFSPENWVEYLKLFDKTCIPIRQNNFGILKGRWIYKNNNTVHFYHLWEYASLEHRQQLRKSLSEVTAWQELFIKPAIPLIEQQDIKIIHPATQNHNFDFAESLSLIDIKCAVGSLKDVVTGLSNSNPQNIQINTVEFPDPNALVLFSKTENDTGIGKDADIKHIDRKVLLSI